MRTKLRKLSVNVIGWMTILALLLSCRGKGDGFAMPDNEALRDTINQLKSISETDCSEQPRKQLYFNLFLEEPICRDILKTVQHGHFKSKIDCIAYKEHALQKNQLMALRVAADEHLNGFTMRLKKQFSRLTDVDVTYCCLYLLGLNDADVSALMQKAYATVCERKRKIRKIVGDEGDLAAFLRNLP